MISLSLSLIRSQVPSDKDPTRTTSFNLIYLLRALAPNTVILRVMASTYEFDGGTQFSLYNE